jgi:hypothetical protein
MIPATRAAGSFRRCQMITRMERCDRDQRKPAVWTRVDRTRLDLALDMLRP